VLNYHSGKTLGKFG
jgi:hypothetical protein